MVLLFPLGLVLMWLYAPWRPRTKWIWSGVGVLVGLAIVGSVAGDNGGGNGTIAGVKPPDETPTLTTDQRLYVESVATTNAGATISARQTIAARPTRTPVPPPYQLALISSSCTSRSDIGFNECEGFVQNISKVSLENVEVVIEWIDAAGVPQASDEALIDYNPILPGQQSPWSTIGTYNPALTQYRVRFKELLGGTILTRDDRP
jgi:hypothetical protein